MKEDRKHIKMNSNHGSRLAADVENLAERSCCSWYAGATMYRSREETSNTRKGAGDISAVEIAGYNTAQPGCSPRESHLVSIATKEELPSNVVTEVLDEGDPEVGQEYRLNAPVPPSFQPARLPQFLFPLTASRV